MKKIKIDPFIIFQLLILIVLYTYRIEPIGNNTSLVQNNTTAIHNINNVAFRASSDWHWKEISTFKRAVSTKIGLSKNYLSVITLQTSGTLLYNRTIAAGLHDLILKHE